jgi:4-amino-4-deoxy-L-arabinose transferase-like glycosyltransferase
MKNRRFANILFWLSAALILGVGLAVRLYRLTDVPLDFHPTRQLRATLIARGMYYETRTDVPEWQRVEAVAQWKNENLIEPPLMERLTAFTYQMIGAEKVWVARVYSILFWTLGGLALLLLGRELGGPAAGLVAAGYYMMVPYAGIASRSFQPDPLMTALICGAWWALARWLRSPSMRWAVAAGLLAGVSIFIKTVAVFFVGLPFAAALVFGIGWKKLIRSRQVWWMLALSLLPYALYFIYAFVLNPYLRSEFSFRFFPHMWLDPIFYLQWKSAIGGTAGFEFFLFALAGSFLVAEKSQRGLVLGAWVGYAAYGLTFPYHTVTHDYYQLPLIPLVGLGLGLAAAGLLRSLPGSKRLAYPVLGLALAFWLVINAWDIRVQLKRNDFSNEVTFWTRMQGVFAPEDQVVGITQDYGYRMAYWGWKSVPNLMMSADIAVRELAGREVDAATAFEEAVAGKDYFLVTMLGELEHQPLIKGLLSENYPLLVETGDYQIYDLRHPLTP